MVTKSVPNPESLNVGIPIAPPVGIVNIWPFPYPSPVFLISKSIILAPCQTTTSIIAPVPKPDDEEVYVSAIPEYDSGPSITTNGGFDVVYPVPGFVIATPVICPFNIDAVPIETRLPLNKLEVPTLTFTVV